MLFKFRLYFFLPIMLYYRCSCQYMSLPLFLELDQFVASLGQPGIVICTRQFITASLCVNLAKLQLDSLSLTLLSLIGFVAWLYWS